MESNISSTEEGLSDDEFHGFSEKDLELPLKQMKNLSHVINLIENGFEKVCHEHEIEDGLDETSLETLAGEALLQEDVIEYSCKDNLVEEIMYEKNLAKQYMDEDMSKAYISKNLDREHTCEQIWDGITLFEQNYMGEKGIEIGQEELGKPA